jgi:hypothetical protein
MGFEIYRKNASRNAEKLWEIVLEAGKPHGLAVIGPLKGRPLFVSRLTRRFGSTRG